MAICNWLPSGLGPSGQPTDWPTDQRPITIIIKYIPVWSASLCPVHSNGQRQITGRGRLVHHQWNDSGQSCSTTTSRVRRKNSIWNQFSAQVDLDFKSVCSLSSSLCSPKWPDNASQVPLNPRTKLTPNYIEESLKNGRKRLFCLTFLAIVITLSTKKLAQAVQQESRKMCVPRKYFQTKTE